MGALQRIILYLYYITLLLLPFQFSSQFLKKHNFAWFSINVLSIHKRIINDFFELTSTIMSGDTSIWTIHSRYDGSAQTCRTFATPKFDLIQQVSKGAFCNERKKSNIFKDFKKCRFERVGEVGRLVDSFILHFREKHALLRQILFLETQQLS